MQIRILLDSGVKAFKTLAEAASTLEKMGVPLKTDPRERLNRELLQVSCGQRSQDVEQMVNSVREICKLFLTPKERVNRQV